MLDVEGVRQAVLVIPIAALIIVCEVETGDGVLAQFLELPKQILQDGNAAHARLEDMALNVRVEQPELLMDAQPLQPVARFVTHAEAL